MEMQSCVLVWTIVQRFLPIQWKISEPSWLDVSHRSLLCFCNGWLVSTVGNPNTVNENTFLLVQRAEFSSKFPWEHWCLKPIQSTQFFLNTEYCTRKPSTPFPFLIVTVQDQSLPPQYPLRGSTARSDRDCIWLLPGTGPPVSRKWEEGCLGVPALQLALAASWPTGSLCQLAQALAIPWFVCTLRAQGTVACP